MATQLNTDNFRALLDANENFLFDCDGVLWHGHTLLPGAAESLALLKSNGKKVYYVTNNSTSTRQQYAAKCQKLGLPAEEKDIVCTAHSAALFLSDLLQSSGEMSVDTRPKIYLIGSPALEKELTAVGINCTGVGPDPMVEGFHADSVILDTHIKAVVVGYDHHISYGKILKAASYLKDLNVPFIATNTDQSFPSTSRAITVPGTGCIVAPVQLASGRNPIVIGKPETLMIDYLRKEYGLVSSRSVFTGDRMNTDMLLAHRCGMKGILVTTTGVNSVSDIEAASKSNNPADRGLVPEFYLDSMHVFSQLLTTVTR